MSFINELKRRNVLRVAAAYVVASWLVIQVVETLFPVFGLSDGAIRVVVIVLAVGFIPIVVLSWAFEVTPEGLKLDKDIDREQSTVPKTSKKLDSIIMIVLAVALAFFAVDRFVLDPARDAELVETTTEKARTDARLEKLGINPIAVLPFENLSEAGDEEYLSDGIAEELLNLLAKVADLRVTARTSAFAFKGRNLSIHEIAEILNVKHILTGSVRSTADQVRITAQLIDVRADANLWSETYDIEIGEVFAVQDEIARAVIEKLEVGMHGETPTVARASPEVYNAYLQATHIHRSRYVDGLPHARELLEVAIEKEPDYAPLWKTLGRVYQELGNAGLISESEMLGLLRRHVNAAAARWPDMPEVNAARGWIAFRYDGDLETAARYYQRAIEGGALPANDFLLTLGRPGDLITLLNYEIARNPLCFYCYHNLMLAYSFFERYEEIEQTYRAARALGFDAWYLTANFALSLILRGDAASALEEIEALEWPEDFETERLWLSAFAYWTLQQESEFDSTFTELKQRTDQFAILSSAELYALTGELDKAFEIFGTLPLSTYGIDYFDGFVGDAMRQHPRWSELAEQVGIYPGDPRDNIPFEINLPR